MAKVAARLDDAPPAAKDCFLRVPERLKHEFICNKDGVIVVRLEWAGGPAQGGRQVLLSAVVSKVQQYKAQLKISPGGWVQFNDATDTLVWLNPVFASTLRISKGTSVVVSAVGGDISRCEKLQVNVSRSDFEIVSHHRGKLQTSLLNQLRVVCRGVMYPVWVPGTPTHITVTMCDTVPACQDGSGLLLTERTEMVLMPVQEESSAWKEGHSREDSSATSASGGSGGTENTEDTGASDSSIQSSWWKLLHLGSGDSEEPSTPGSQQGAGLAQYLSALFPFTKDQRSLPQDPHAPDRPQSALGKEQGQSSKTLLGETIELPFGKGREKLGQVSGHRKQPSLPARLEGEPEVVERLTSEYINTPRMTVSLRVQPGAQLSRPGCEQCAEGRVPAMLDAVIHPSTLPEVFHTALLVRRQRGSTSRVNFLVKVKLLPFVEPFGPEESTSGSSNQGSPKPPSSDSGGDKSLSAASTALPTKVQAPVLVVRLLLQDTLHPQPTQCSSEAASPLDGPAFTESSVDSEAESEDSSDRELDELETSLIPKPVNHGHSVTRKTSCATVVPGHVVLSDMVRRELGVGLYGRVQLTELAERHKQTCLKITLQPLKEYKSAEEVKNAFMRWLWEEACQPHRDIPLTQHLVVPLLLSEGSQPVLCRLDLVTRSSRSNAHLLFCLVNPSDVRERIAVEVDNSLCPKGEGTPPPSLNTLDPPLTYQVMNTLGAVSELTQECLHFLCGSLFCPVAREPTGGVSLARGGAKVLAGEGLLICGAAKGYSSGCGRTSLAVSLCHLLMAPPLAVSVVEVQGRTLKGSRSGLIKQQLCNAFAQARWQQPSVILFDDLDLLCRSPPGVESDPYQEGPQSHKVVDCLVELAGRERQRGTACVLVATAETKEGLHPRLVGSRGGQHVFGKIAVLHPPSTRERLEILEAVIATRKVPCSLTPKQRKELGRRTEGYLPLDLVVVVERSLNALEQRVAGEVRAKGASPREALSTVSEDTPMKNASFDIPDPPLSWRRFSEGRSSRRQSQPQSVLSVSMATLFDVASPSPCSLTGEDLIAILKEYAPSALRGVTLQKAGGIGFHDVGGLRAAKETLTKVILWPSKYPSLFESVPMKMQFGILLFGPPGTGKTLLGSAVAKEFDMNFISVKGPELLSKYIGSSEEAVREVFERAQAARPCVLFFDEFESLVPRRGHDATGVTDRVVNQFLTQLDGTEGLTKGVYVLAATSRPDMIDPALLRPGRVDRKLYCKVPCEEELVDILSVMCRDLPLDSDVRLRAVAEKCSGFTGADLKALLYNAQLVAAHEALERAKVPGSLPGWAARAAEEGRDGLRCLSAMEEQEDGEESKGAQEELGQTLTVPETHSSPSSPKKGKVSSRPPSLYGGYNKRQLPSRSISEPFVPASSDWLRRRHTHTRGSPCSYVSLARSSSVVATDWRPQAECKIALVKRNRGQLKLGLSPVLPSPHLPHGGPHPHTLPGKEVTSDKAPGANLICQRHLLEALKTTRPSLSDSERERFETICQRFLAGRPTSVHDYLTQKSTHA